MSHIVYGCYPSMQDDQDILLKQRSSTHTGLSCLLQYPQGMNYADSKLWARIICCLLWQPCDTVQMTLRNSALICPKKVSQLQSQMYIGTEGKSPILLHMGKSYCPHQMLQRAYSVLTDNTLGLLPVKGRSL